MKLLAFDTATDRLHIGVTSGGRSWTADEPGGAATSATFLPLVLQMLKTAGLAVPDLDAIAFGQGPGSFTGLRTACAVAQGLAFGSNRPVVAVPTLMAVAEHARLQTGATRVCVAVDARMDQLYSQGYIFDSYWVPQMLDIMAISPENLQCETGFCLAGNAQLVFGSRLGAGRLPLAEALIAAPTGQALLNIAMSMWQRGHSVSAQNAQPLYVRDKVAQTTAERAQTQLEQRTRLVQ